MTHNINHPISDERLAKNTHVLHWGHPRDHYQKYGLSIPQVWCVCALRGGDIIEKYNPAYNKFDGWYWKLFEGLNRNINHPIAVKLAEKERG